MKHVDWLHPDHIILSNFKSSISYQEFTKHMRSRNFQDLRLLKLEGAFYIRYKFDGESIWYSANILQKKGKDYYIEVGTSSIWTTNELERMYIPLNREEKLNQLLK
jgi:hypothetical protein